MKSENLSRIVLYLFCTLVLQVSGRAVEKDGGLVAYPAISGSPGPAVFSHRAHGIRGAGFACNQCHVPESSKSMNTTMDGIRQGQDCGSCHDGKTKGPRSQTAAASIQNCPGCHMPAADIVISLNRMDPVAFSHSRHLGADSKKKISKTTGFSCRDCHPSPFERVAKGPVGMEVPHETGGCASCHNGRKRSDGNPTAFSAATRCLTCHRSQ
jgi:c(7)-type cytochrome triheme protein